MSWAALNWAGCDAAKHLSSFRVVYAFHYILHRSAALLYFSINRLHLSSAPWDHLWPEYLIGKCVPVCLQQNFMQDNFGVIIQNMKLDVPCSFKGVPFDIALLLFYGHCCCCHFDYCYAWTHSLASCLSLHFSLTHSLCLFLNPSFWSCWLES